MDIWVLEIGRATTILLNVDMCYFFINMKIFLCVYDVSYNLVVDNLRLKFHNDQLGVVEDRKRLYTSDLGTSLVYFSHFFHYNHDITDSPQNI